ncbi:MAG: hypothetical protein A2Y88_05500 [Chloroflexi bacterium RBG_13_48_10]|nr:MAG: hypothetical protein A2Y88_05500 [Chloroflexi bacterium RBG_13_48_10]
MLPLERAAKLRQEANVILGLIRLYDILRLYGKVFPTGSFFLDVMAYPDIDLYLTKVNLEQLFHIGAKLARCDLVTQVVFEKTDDPVNLPNGLYLKLRMNYGDWGRPWKIDIWSLDEKVIMDKMTEMRHFQSRMTPELREQITNYKLSVMTSQKRTPAYSGYYIYRAFMDEGLTDFDSVTQYLIAHGIQMKEQEGSL